MTEKQFNQIEDYIHGKEVLHIGAVDHSFEASLEDWWTHDYLVRDANKVVGLDILDEANEKLRKKGYDMITADAQDFDIDDSFDVVFAGEFIEHISNKGSFLRSVKKHLRPDGELILTTPNVFSFRYILRNFQSGGLKPNEEHTCWFCRYTIQELLDRHGFEITEIGYYEDVDRSTKPEIIDRLWVIFVSLFPDRFLNQMYVVAEVD